MAAAGFCDELLDAHGDWLCLEGTAKALKKGTVSALPAAMLKGLEVRRTEVEAEILALDGAPSVHAALRTVRESGASLSECKIALNTVLTAVANILRNPKVRELPSPFPYFHLEIRAISAALPWLLATCRIRACSASR